MSDESDMRRRFGDSPTVVNSILSALESVGNHAAGGGIVGAGSLHSLRMSPVAYEALKTEVGYDELLVFLGDIELGEASPEEVEAAGMTRNSMQFLLVFHEAGCGGTCEH